MKAKISQSLRHPIFLFLLVAANAPEEVLPLYLIISGLLILVFSHLKNRWLIHLQTLGVLLSLFLIISKYRTIFSLDAGCNFLTLLLGFKALENRPSSMRGFVFIAIALNASFSLYHQDLFATLLLIGSFLWGFYLLYQQTLDENQAQADFRLNIFRNPRIYLYATFTIFIALSFYVFFPRITFNFPKQSGLTSNSGFSPDLNPGTQSKLTLSNQSIFSVAFAQDAPALPELYWVGSVLEETDGYHWKVSHEKKVIYTQSHKIKSLREKSIDYQVQLHTQSTEHLFHLDFPTSTPQIPMPYYMSSNKSFMLYSEVPAKLNYKAKALLNYHAPVNKDSRFEPPSKYIKNTQKVIALAKSLKGKTSEATLANIANYFQDNNFLYSLEPGRTELLDDFLFKTQKGFCSHYASATAVILRYIGIYSRVITGFQGGEYNNLGDFYVLKGKDAHAWVEYLNEEKRWVRVDPVEWIKPERLTLGGQRFFALSPNGEVEIQTPNLSMLDNIQINITKYIDNMNRNWQSVLYNYDREAQRDLAKKLGLSIWRFFLVGLLSIPILAAITLLFFMRQKRMSPIQKELQRIEVLARKKGIQRQNSQSFTHFLTCLAKTYQSLGQPAQELQKNVQIFYFSNQPYSQQDFLKELIQFRKLLQSVLK